MTQPTRPPSHPPTYACIAAGGTGGHVVPGLAVARELVDRGHPIESIVFVGSEHGVGAGHVTEAGFELRRLPGRGVERKLSRAALKAIVDICRGVIQGVAMLRRMRPQVVVLLGGYASVPCIVASVLLRIPMVVVARDVRVGAADRLAGLFATVCAVPFAGTDLPHAVVTGLPVRSEVLSIDRQRDRRVARSDLGLPEDRVMIGVFTGSLGSRRVNDAVMGLVTRWADRDDLIVRHVLGTRDWETVQADLPHPPPGGLMYQPLRYEDRIAVLLAASDIVVSRAGGGTVAEIATVGLPSVLVPLPIAPRDHQTANAMALVDAGAALLVPDDELDTDRLGRELTALVDDAGRRKEMGDRARELSRPDAAARVADLVESSAGRQRARRG
jgi:UDP-N-acetylglucosamine--N-acetylmuramyl-(pentapeptide) pyrophosphoryl-undecaprenol N-acetylglucosamine transferase